MLELLRHALVGGDDLVERVGDLALDADLVARQPDGEIADAHGLQRAEQLVEIEAMAVQAVGSRSARRGSSLRGRGKAISGEACSGAACSGAACLGMAILSGE